eukprot:10830786-Karenia_brevis.AAC.1
MIFRTTKQCWQSKRWGLEVNASTHTCVTNLRFADDVLLLGRTRKQVEHMLTDLNTEAGMHGLKLHPDKTKVLTNTQGGRRQNKQTFLDIAGLKIEILRLTGSVKYLGRQLTFDRIHETELDNRINAGWKKVGIYKEELT